ncbi:MAG: heparan-alpha-glucosaminide N-acetyltransferase domain-containing protein [Ferruginibacter sp.]
MTSLTRHRIESLDLLKGLVIVIMAIDHTRDYFHYSSYFFDPTDPALTTAPLFFTRFITNFCAPAFSFLAGLSAFIVGKRKTPAELSGFLLKRGLWLVFVELIIMNFGWCFDITFRTVSFQVIWVLGISMIFLAALIHLPKKVIFIFSCLLIFGHNLLDNIRFENSILWTFLHERKPFLTTPGHIFRVSYSIIPWVAVMSLGYCFGSFYDKTFEPSKRQQLFNIIGITAIVFFLILRGINIYGDLLPWKDYGILKQTIFSFFNLAKYPPSLSFLLLTLGGTFLFLANSEKLNGSIVNFFCVFGRVPFFFYIIHIYLIHFLALLVASFTVFGWQKMILPAMPFRVEALKGFGFNLAIVYLIWIFVIILLYPLCKKFDTYKKNNKDKWWLSYL